MHFAFYNGTELKPESLNIPFNGNRGLFYGDGLFETIKVVRGRLIFLKDHISRLTQGCRQLGLKVPEGCNEAAINQLISNTSVTNGRVRLTVWRDCSGFYLPDSDDTSWLLTVAQDADETGSYLSRAITLTLYRENQKSPGWLSNIKSLSGLIYVTSAQYAKAKGADEALIINSDGNIAETTSSNIFIRDDHCWITPPLSEGCLDGVMRKKLLLIMQKSGITVIEKKLTPDAIFNAGEIIVTNVVKGVRQVADVDGKKFGGRSAVAFTAQLNADLGLD